MQTRGVKDQIRVGAKAGGFGEENVSIDCINNDCGNRPKEILGTM